MKSSTGPLNVFFESNRVGAIELGDDLQMHFRYTDNWLGNDNAFPISLSMPLRPDGYLPPTSHNFFANLLPEANVRQRVCVKLKISPGNDFELLRAIGGDCAGALTLTSATEAPTHQVGSLQPITDAQLAEWSTGSAGAFSAVSGEGGVRLSLAGAQDKLPVRSDGDQFFLPQDDLASTHLLKFASPFFSHLPENEAFTSLLAKDLGLPVVDLHLLRTVNSQVLVIERYDRMLSDGTWHRLHQEDVCQALGISHLQKYEKEGGPSLQQCAQLIRAHCSMPAIDIDHLIQWSLFNLLAGNSDAHGKNLSILYRTDGSVGLAPFYDLVCTRNYDRVDRHLAMSIGGETDPGLVGHAHLVQLATDLGVRETLVLKTLDELIKRIPTALDKVVQQFENAHGDSPVLERLPMIIRQQLRRTQTLRAHVTEQ